MRQMLTPKRYTRGFCTIAVAMLADVHWPLPYGPEREYAPTDVSSFQEIYESAESLEILVSVIFFRMNLC